MTESMKAAVYEGVGKLIVKEVPRPALKPGGLVAKVACCAICGTDFKMYYAPNPRVKPPVIIGHEFAARVVESATPAFRPGDRITMATSVACGECWLCRKGLGNLCDGKTCLGTDAPGAYAEFLAVPARAVRLGNVVRVPESVSDELGSLAEPLSCVINSQIIAGVGPGDTVAILGAGPLGCLHALCARARGAGRVIVCQRSESRARLARELPVDEVVTSGSPVEDVLRLTSKRGADRVIVAASDRKAHEDSIRMVRKGGVVNLFASLPKGDSELALDSRLIHYHEISLTGASDSRPEHVEAALGLLADSSLPWPKLITHRVALDRILDGIRVMGEKSGLKVLVYPT